MEFTVQNSQYMFLDNFVKVNLGKLYGSRIYIFGAGIKGCSLLKVLRMHNLKDIWFVDNNSLKQGTVLDGCSIISFAEAKSYSEKCVFLCPSANNETILEQIAKTGRVEGEDYFNLNYKDSDYLEIVKEMKEKENDYVLGLGSCVFSTKILSEDISKSLGERLHQELNEKSKVYSLAGFTPAMYYYLISALDIKNNKPQLVILGMELFTLSSCWEQLCSEQHKLLLKHIESAIEDKKELVKYINDLEKRLTKREQGGMLAEYKDVKEFIKKSSVKRFFYDLHENYESVIYMKKILSLLNENNIPVVLLFTPIDYVTGEGFFGKEFRVRYEEVKKKYLSFIDEYSFHYINASFIVPSDCFAFNPRNISFILNVKGQDKFINYLREQKVLHSFLCEREI